MTTTIDDMATTTGDENENMATTPKHTTGWAVVETLAGYGIDTVFGIPGTHNLEIYRPLDHFGIRAVTTRHEQAAGYAADGWSLQTGLPGVVVTTSGPGLLNALSAAGTAFCESRPMIVLAPGPARGAEFADDGSLHETKDQLGAASAIVEWGRRVLSAEEAVEAVHDAFALFATTRPRPVYIEVPLDLLDSVVSVNPELLKPREPSSIAAPSTEAVARAADALREAADPVILAGGGSRCASAELTALAERLAAPVVTSFNGKGVMDEFHPLSLGSNLRLAAARDRARQADVVLIVGAKLGEAELWTRGLDAQGTVIRVDVLESQLDKNQSAGIGIRGDAKAVLAGILSELDAAGVSATAPAERTEAAHAGVVVTRAKTLAECAELSEVNATLAQHLVTALPEDAIMATDSSQIAYWGLLNTLRVRTPNSTPYMGTYATLGYGLPAAMGAKIACPERPAFVVVGDGALMFSMQEFITVVEQGLDLTVVVADNGGYAEIKQNEKDLGIAPVGVDLAQPNWVAVATAFGGAGRRVTTPEELMTAVDNATKDGGLQLIHIKQEDFTA